MGYTELIALIAIICLAFLAGALYERLRNVQRLLTVTDDFNAIDEQPDRID